MSRPSRLLTTASVDIDESKFKTVNNRDRNFTRERWSGDVLSWRKASRAL
jgi:hypothetical protein